MTQPYDPHQSQSWPPVPIPPPNLPTHGFPISGPPVYGAPNVSHHTSYGAGYQASADLVKGNLSGTNKTWLIVLFGSAGLVVLLLLGVIVFCCFGSALVGGSTGTTGQVLVAQR